MTAALPHVVVDKTVVGGPVAYIGESKTWRIAVTSDGHATAFGVDVSDVLPANWTYDAGSAQLVVDGGTPQSRPTGYDDLRGRPDPHVDRPRRSASGHCARADLQRHTANGVVTTPGVGASVDHVNTASTTAEDGDGNQGPAGGGSYNGPPDTAIANIHSADVSVAKAHTGTPVAGQPFSWSVTVANAGPDTAVGPFTVTDTLPTGVTGASASGAGWTCSSTTTEITCARTTVTDTLASGASFPVITVTVNVPADVVEGTVLTNAVAVTDKTYDPVPSNNSDDDQATVDASADLAMDKQLSGPLVAGSSATYTLDVTNLGPSASRGQITVTDALPAGSTFESAAGDGWACSHSAGVVTCTRSGLVRPRGAAADHHHRRHSRRPDGLGAQLRDGRRAARRQPGQ